MSRYKTARSMGSSREGAVLFESRDIVDEELKFPREEMAPAEFHTVIANARQDISAMAILLSSISAQQRQCRWLLTACLVVLVVIAARM